MKNVISKRFFAFAAAICLIVGMTPAAVMAEEPEQVKYVALGDSITSGYGLTYPENDSFPAVVAKDNKYSLCNLGESGETSATLLNKLLQPETAAEIVSADVITITIGGNDMMNALYAYLTEEWNNENPQNPIKPEDMKENLEKGDLKTLMGVINYVEGFGSSTSTAGAFAAFAGNLTAIANKIKTANPDVLLIVATQYNPYIWLPGQCDNPLYTEYLSQIEEAFEKGVGILNQMIQSTEINYPGIFTTADVYSAFMNSEEDNLCNASYTPGDWFPVINLDFHPNGKGHTVIAGAVTESINTCVNEILEKAVAAANGFGTLTVDQKDASSPEAAQAWAEAQVQGLSETGAGMSWGLDKYVPADAGTKENPDGTDGSFEILVTFSFAGQSQSAGIPVTIKATVYTEPAKEPDNEENKTDGGEKKEDTQQVKDTVKEPVQTTAVKTVKTGDSAEVAPYIALMVVAVAAVIVVAVIIYRKTRRH